MELFGRGTLKRQHEENSDLDSKIKKRIVYSDGITKETSNDGVSEFQEDKISKDDEFKFIISEETHETQIAEDVEANLHKHYSDCTKNSGHKDFIPFLDFNICHIPFPYCENDTYELIKVTGDLTVRLVVTMTSTERPKYFPIKNKSSDPENKMYPFYPHRGKKLVRKGTGTVTDVTINCIDGYFFGRRKCFCKDCSQSATPKLVCGKVTIKTATHVVFDDIEARHTECRFFFDREDSPLMTLKGSKIERVNVYEDCCYFECESCDMDLLNSLKLMLGIWQNLRHKVSDDYNELLDPINFIVSHPHGGPKMVTMGEIERWHMFEESDDDDVPDNYHDYDDQEWNKTKSLYKTPTCPGSSGACITSLRGSFHVHSGFNHEENLNFSSIEMESFNGELKYSSDNDD